ncbi:N-succinyl-L,L-diaminopimelate aminotransferase [Cutibacterium acnes JCM 18918]|nr:N-succinyl-L,L-diaminopimelate aminotransferase [Cutibacterium acnes JCM 18918]
MLEQVKRYRLRRNVLKPALEKAGFRIDHSEGSLYLWATHDEDCRVTLDRLADLGILCSPGDFLRCRWFRPCPYRTDGYRRED